MTQGMLWLVSCWAAVDVATLVQKRSGVLSVRTAMFKLGSEWSCSGLSETGRTCYQSPLPPFRC